MEQLMPKLVGLMLNQVVSNSLTACHFMCSTWKMCTPPPPLPGFNSKVVAANSWLGMLQWA
jgi:hypothetical protein